MLPAQDSLALEQLGWSSFQDLAIALCEDIYQYPINTFSPTKDRGIDGVIEPISGKGELSKSIIQVKHTSTAQRLERTAISKELAKIAQLALEKEIDHYIFVTNLRASVTQWLDLKEELLKINVKRTTLIGRENIVRRVRKSASLRGMVPRLYGIGDLSQILDERRFTQAKAMLDAVRSDLDKFVVTETYKKALDALRTHKILVLLGDPAVGKSTIARCLAMASVDEFDARPMILESISKLSDHWNPDDNRRLFWIDDAFGVTQKNEADIADFNHAIPMINAAMRKGSRFIFTSRTYIWRLAHPQLKLSALSGDQSSRIEIDVRRFTEFERGQIVYNHIKFGDQSKEWKSAFKTLLPIVTRHRNFKPEVARRLGLTAFTASLRSTPDSLDRFVSNPATFLEETISGLDDSSRAALSALLMSGGSIPSPVGDSKEIDAVCKLYSAHPADVRRRLSSLDGSFIKREADDNGAIYWRFWHPTIGEALASVAMQDSELMDVYVEGAPIKRMLAEVTCAGRPVKGAILELGSFQFERFISRLKSSNLDVLSVLPFLAHRTTATFRRKFFIEPPTTKSRYFLAQFLRWTVYIDLIYLLWKDNFIGDDLLTEFLNGAKDGIENSADEDFLDKRIQEMMGTIAFEDCLRNAWHNLKETPWEIITPLEESLDDETDPDDHFHQVVSFAACLQEWLDDDELEDITEEIQSIVSERASEITAEREEKRQENEDEPHDDYWELGHDSYSSSPSRTVTFDRTPTDPLVSLFSDIDDA